MSPAVELDRVLLIQLRQLGDVIATSALLEDLRAALPSARIDFLTGAKPAQLLKGNPFVSDVLRYERNHVLRSMREVRSRRYQLIIDSQSSPRSAPIVMASGSPQRLGWRINGPWRLAYNATVPRGPTGYVVRDRQRLLEHLAIPIAPRRPRLYLDQTERAAGMAAARALKVPPGSPRVGMVVSAGNPASVWPVERFAELATRLAAEGVTPVVVRTYGDDAVVARCLALAPAAIRADVPDLRIFLGFMAAMDLMVMADTGPAHMAQALDLPSVVLYGPSPAEYWSHRLPTTASVSSPRVRCPACLRGRLRSGRGGEGHSCMIEITVDAVHQRVTGMLAAGAPHRPT